MTNDMISLHHFKANIDIAPIIKLDLQL